MTTGLVLIAAILVLGGVVATVGDRLGMRVGKARLSLFNLRPRQTATLITILTGSVISASTFAILFAISDQLRTGVFELGEIQDDLRDAREELDQAATEKRQIERELNQSTRQRNAARRQLTQINRSLERSQARQEQTETQLNRSQAELSQTQAQLSRTQSQINQIQTNFQQAQSMLRMVSQQATQLRAEIQQLQTERQALIEQQEQVRQQIAQRDQEIAVREAAIAERDRAIEAREALLEDLENQRSLLAQEIASLEQQVQRLVREFQGLRQGNVALLRNQSLASGVLRVVTPSAAPQAVEQLLRQANETALQRIRPGVDSSQQVIQITNAEVEQLINQIDDGQDYVVRILSEGNYVVGEPCVISGDACVQVYAAAARNQIIYLAGEVVAATTADPTALTNARLIERINLLVAAAQFRAQQAGLLSDVIQISDGRTETIIAFFDRLRQHNQPVELQAIAAETTYTAGPLRIELVALQDGQVLFSTESDEQM